MPGKKKRGRGPDKDVRASRATASAVNAAAKKAKKVAEVRQGASASMMRNFVGMASTAAGSAA